MSESCPQDTPDDRAPADPSNPESTPTPRRLDDALIDGLTWARLTALSEQRGAYRRRRALAQVLDFLAFHGAEDGFLRELKRLEFLYAKEYYGGNLANGRKRFYEHVDAAERAGYLMQTHWPSGSGRAEYRVTMPLDALPRGLPLDLAMHLQVEERYRDPEAGLAPVTVVGRTPSKTAETAATQPLQPAPVTDLAAAAKAKYLALEPWLDDVYLVAAAMRIEQLDAQAAGREYDEQQAEAEARAKLGTWESDDYEVVAESELQAVAAAPQGPVKPQVMTLTLQNPDTWPYSREGSFPLGLLTYYWLDLRKEGRKTERPPSSADIEVGPSERRRASALVRAEIYHVWRDWELANPAARRALTEGQWHDLTCTIALALRRTTAAAVVEECTRALGTARDLAAVVGSRLWALIRGSAEWPEWAEYRRGLMRSVEPSWTWPTPPGVVGLASARAALRRARGGVERVGTQLELVGAAANPSAHADQARRAVGVAAMGAERYRYGQVIPDTERPGLAEMLTAAAAVARSIAAAIPTRPVVDRAEAERIRAEAAAYSAKVDAERPALRAAALAEARASRRARGKDR